MAGVCNLFVEKSQDPVPVESSEQLRSARGSDSVALEDHSKSFQRPGSLTNQLCETVIIGLAKYLNVASEEVRKRFTDLFWVLCRSDLSLSNN